MSEATALAWRRDRKFTTGLHSPRGRGQNPEWKKYCGHQADQQKRSKPAFGGSSTRLRKSLGNKVEASMILATPPELFSAASRRLMSLGAAPGLAAEQEE